jgi:hypothetical protein
MKAFLAAGLIVCLTLAGCSGKTHAPGTDTGTGTKPPLEAGKGAISGLVIDDVYRPVPNAFVLVEKAGLTATSDGEGQFTLTGLDPGAYILKVQADGHAAAPKNVDVNAGQYAEVEIQADRLFNQGSRIVTTEYSAFISCAADFVVNGIIGDCLNDQSGDSYRPGFTSNVTQLGLTNITYMVTEVLMNQVGNWVLQVREDDGSPGGGERYAVQSIEGGRYIKIINQFGVKNTESDEQHRNVPWVGAKPFQTLVFYEGQFKGEFTQAGQPVADANATVPVVDRHIGNPLCCGVGAGFGIEAKFVQSIFLGAPPMDINSYSTLKPSS